MNRRIDETLLLGRAGQIQTGEKSTSLRTHTSFQWRFRTESQSSSRMWRRKLSSSSARAISHLIGEVRAHERTPQPPESTRLSVSGGGFF
jgi:hypothetical protein